MNISGSVYSDLYIPNKLASAGAQSRPRQLDCQYILEPGLMDIHLKLTKFCCPE